MAFSSSSLVGLSERCSKLMVVERIWMTWSGLERFRVPGESLMNILMGVESEQQQK